MSSNYYKQNFVSIQPLWEEVKEELSSYFRANALDDVMFPKWTEHCLRRFRKSSLKIEETTLELKDYTACLPTDFDSVRELWLTTIVHQQTIQNPSVTYTQSDCRIDRVAENKCEPCFDDGTQTCTTQYMVVNKLTNTFYFSFEKTYLLSPGNLNSISKCGDYCANLKVSNGESTFDINNNKIITNFPEGTLYLMYYSNPLDDSGEQLVPDDFWVQDYIRKFIIMKCYQKLLDVPSDEPFSILAQKLQIAERNQAEAFVLAEINLKKETVQDKMRKIRQSYNVNNKYYIPQWNNNKR